MLRGVLFDLDDTLVDQRTAAEAAVVAWAAERGISDPGAAARWTTITEIQYARYQQREISFVEQRRARVREFLGQQLSDADADRSFSRYLTRYEDGWTRYDDAAPALGRARAAGLTIAVFTNGEEEQQRRKLARLGLEEEVDLLIASSTLVAGKPDPRAFTQALGRVGVSATEALMVGDSLDKDIAPALDAGMAAVLIDRSAAHPDAPVPRITTLDALDFGVVAPPATDR